MAPVADRLKKFTRVSVPILLSIVSMNFNEEQIHFASIGRNVEDLDKLSGIGIGNMVLNMLPYSIMLGVNSALEISLKKTGGNGRTSVTSPSENLHRANLIIFCLFIPIAISFFYIEHLLCLFRIDEETAAFTRQFLTLSLPAVLANALTDSLDLFLLSKGH